jgi:hypothetical protein
MRTIKAELLEAGKDFEIKVRGSHGDPPTKDMRIVRFNNPNIKISVKALKERIEALQAKYPDKGFSLERVRVGNRIYWLIDRKAKGTKNLPIYYSTKLKRIFVPKRYVRRQYRLTCTVLLYRLRDLGASYTLGYA